MNKKRGKVDFILSYFQEHLPQAQTELQYSSPYQLMVAVVLSAQCTDKRVNQVTPELFREFPDFKALAKASEDQLFPLISSISYPNSKTRNLILGAQKVMDEFGGELPMDRDQLMRIPGVGRKTANVLLSVLWDQPTMAVDTHVFRVSARLGLSPKAKTPLETEKILVRLFPGPLISRAHHWLILHGRYVCKARKPECAGCGLRPVCSYYEKTGGEASKA